MACNNISPLGLYYWHNSLMLDHLSMTLDQLPLTSDQLSMTLDQLSMTLDQLSLTVDELSMTLDQLFLTVDQLSMTLDQLLMTSDLFPLILDQLSYDTTVAGITAINVCQYFCFVFYWVNSTLKIKPKYIKLIIDNISPACYCWIFLFQPCYTTCDVSKYYYSSHRAWCVHVFMYSTCAAIYWKMFIRC